MRRLQWWTHEGDEEEGEEGEDEGGGHLFLRLCVGYEAASPGAWSLGFV